jgi:hypothetical protein
MRKLLATVIESALGLGAGTALAEETTATSPGERGDRIDHRLDRRGARIARRSDR